VHHLLARRPVGGGELAFFTCHAPAGTTLAELVRLAGARWGIEECFQAAKTRPAWIIIRSAGTTPGTVTPLCLCSRWPSSPLPQLKGGTTACGQLSRTPPPHDRDRPVVNSGDLISLTAGEIRRLFAVSVQPHHQDDYYLRWSRWRRRHQGRARRSHYWRRQQLNLSLSL